MKLSCLHVTAFRKHWRWWIGVVCVLLIAVATVFCWRFYQKRVVRVTVQRAEFVINGLWDAQDIPDTITSEETGYTTHYLSTHKRGGVLSVATRSVTDNSLKPGELMAQDRAAAASLNTSFQVISMRYSDTDVTMHATFTNDGVVYEEYSRGILVAGEKTMEFYLIDGVYLTGRTEDVAKDISVALQSFSVDVPKE